MKLIREADFNAVLLEDKELLDANFGWEELTRVDTLKTKIESVCSIAPFAQMFGQTLEQFMEYVNTTVNEEKERMIASVREEWKSTYEKDFDLLERKDFVDFELLKSLNLEVQLLTTIMPYASRPLYGQAFIVGDGVFYEIFLDECSDDLYRNMLRNERGIVIPTYNADYEIVNKEYATVVDRDFRKYPVLENIAWCARNLKLDSDVEFADIQEGAVKFSIYQNSLINLFFPNTCNGIYFVDGKVKTYRTII